MGDSASSPAADDADGGVRRAVGSVGGTDAPDEAAERLRRLLDHALPELTSDEVGSGGSAASPRSDEDYLADRPPHHGG